MSVKLTKTLLALLVIAAGTISLTGCDKGGEEGNGNGNGNGDAQMKIIFSADSYTADPAATISMPFTVSGSKGAELKITATTDNTEASAETKMESNAQGNVEFTSPAIVTADQITVNVTLKVHDLDNDKEIEASVPVVVTKSPDLAFSFKSLPAIAVLSSGGSFNISFEVTDVGAATLSKPEMTLPTGWSSEITMNGNEGVARVTAPATLPQSVEFTISVADNHERKASETKTVKITDAATVGNIANSYIVKPGESFTFNAFVKGNTIVPQNDNSDVSVAMDAAELLWQDAIGLVKSVTANVDNGTITVATDAAKSGNAVVVAKYNGNITWNWHLWITDYDPDTDNMVWKSSTGEEYVLMDRNLGARNATIGDVGANGLYYQWGRKDPFIGSDGVESLAYAAKYDIDGNPVEEVNVRRPVYSDNTSTNLQLAIENPNTFYHAGGSLPIDWLTDKANLQNGDLWGNTTGMKTMYDPCPVGWRVPGSAVFGFRQEYAYSKENGFDETKPYFWHDKNRNYNFDGTGEKQGTDLGYIYRPSTDKVYWIPMAGARAVDSGIMASVGGSGFYFTYRPTQTYAEVQMFAYGNIASVSGLNRSYGGTIRCEKIK